MAPSPNREALRFASLNLHTLPSYPEGRKAAQALFQRGYPQIKHCGPIKRTATNYAELSGKNLPRAPYRQAKFDSRNLQNITSGSGWRQILALRSGRRMDEPVVTTMVRAVLAREKAPQGRAARALVAENGAKPLDSKLSEIFQRSTSVLVARSLRP